MLGRLAKIFLPALTALFLVGSFVNQNAQAGEQIQTNFNFPNCQSLIGTPGDQAHYTNGIHQIVGGPLLQGSDDVYSQPNGNFVQCFCPLTGSVGIQTNWLRTDEPVSGWFFENGLQWNLGNYTYAAQNSDFSCQSATGGGGEGGAQAPSCPVDNLPQKPDQVWVTDKKPGQATVHWVNKGDAQGFHLAYGFAPNHWLWGVEVGNVDQFTISGLPDGDIFFTIIPLGANNCPGFQSEPNGGQVLGASTLAATGSSNSLILFALGLGSISLGLWQAQIVLQKRGIKA